MLQLYSIEVVTDDLKMNSPCFANEHNAVWKDNQSSVIIIIISFFSPVWNRILFFFSIEGCFAPDQTFKLGCP